MGFSKTDIANAVKLVMAIAGGFLGGLLAQRFRIMHAMMIGAILACATNLLFVVLTYNPGSLPIMYMAVIFDNLVSWFCQRRIYCFLIGIDSYTFYRGTIRLFFLHWWLWYLKSWVAIRALSLIVCHPFFFIFTFAIGIPILALIYFVDKYIVIGDNDDIYGDSDSDGEGGSGIGDKLTKANPNLTDTKEPPRASE